MSLSTEARMNALLLNEQGKEDLRIETPSGIFLIDLKPENLRLWGATLQRNSDPCNLLLACESDQGEITTTRLTWVVGSAIRQTHIEDSNQAGAILKSLGVHSDLVELAKEHCPGLGEDVPWAFYLDRHGSLAASPVLTMAQLLKRSPAT